MLWNAVWKISPTFTPTPVESDIVLVDQIETEPSDHVSDGSASVGWEHLVAPVNQAPRQGISSAKNSPHLGNVLQLSGGGDAPT